MEKSIIEISYKHNQMSFPNKITRSYKNEKWNVKTMTMSLRISNKHGNLFKKMDIQMVSSTNMEKVRGVDSGVWSPNCLNAQIILIKAQIIPHPHKHKI